jgi:hypothetical protein
VCTEILREDYGYGGSVDLMRKRMAEMPTRSRNAGRERRLYALICSLPYARSKRRATRAKSRFAAWRSKGR